MLQTVLAITPADLARRLGAGERLALLDVREEFERASCSIRVPSNVTDLHIPMGQVPARAVEVNEAAAGGPVVVYCHHGVRSMVVARWLAARGVAGLLNLEGGIDAWSSEVDPAVPRY
ncbi:MAG TPA: rhodanese-like domain-containing protein [Isosphaeraceae bacterium]|jgi:rhodanese-related sulfurtransferase|nr:rhodanese-like domain-containing protein [Isosphaeraceae bacterium]